MNLSELVVFSDEGATIFVPSIFFETGQANELKSDSEKMMNLIAHMKNWHGYDMYVNVYVGEGVP